MPNTSGLLSRNKTNRAKCILLHREKLLLLLADVRRVAIIA